MATALNCCLSSSCFSLQSKLNSLSLKTNINSSSSYAFKTLSFSSNLSHNLFSKGNLSFSTVTPKPFHRSVVVCEVAPKKKADSAAKRARQAEKRRVYHKAKKSEVKTRMKKVLTFPIYYFDFFFNNGYRLNSVHRILEMLNFGLLCVLEYSQLFSHKSQGKTRFLIFAFSALLFLSVPLHLLLLRGYNAQCNKVARISDFCLFCTSVSFCAFTSSVTSKVLEALDVLRKKPDAAAEEIFSIEKLIAEAYSVIDKAVKVGSLHRNTGARRKSRLARRKKAVEIHHGWYAPVPAENAA
ncbi:hypothetical protein CXB51_009808 [Gossypium anomalum]|uniref:Ribosomal protein S20 n=1 Tax=Gossypium anomalum TaxID=47600 RepID=A0A8J5Z7C3_9ROSI|nr:hypothetical protein CXB51_009808 [Gossypium anomalum]